MRSVWEIVARLFDTSGFPARWYCGTWTAAHGWTHIVADFAIFGAYAAIPCVLTYFISRRRDIPFQRIFWLFSLFILSCGFGHLIEATIFWHPWYRFSALIKVVTALVSWATVIALVPLVPRALALPGLATVNLRLQAEIDQRKLADERFRLVVESAPNAVVMINQDGLMILVNSSTEKFFGYAREELLGRPVEMLVPDRFRDPHPAYRQQFFRVPVARSMGQGQELYGRRKDGSEFPVEIGLNPIPTPEGLLVLSAIVDITERKLAEEESRRRLAELAHVGRLSTVGEMVSSLAHEINQPLAAAANYSRACVRFARSGKGVTTEQMLDWMEKSADQATRACEIVKRLGAFVRKESSPRAHVDVNQIIDEVVAVAVDGLLNKDETGRIALEMQLSPTLPLVEADRVQVEQVLLNLVRNGLESMRHASDANRLLILQSTSEDGFIQIRVNDRGPGVSPENTARLFDPFFTTKSNGMGLGLSISRSIIDAHGGQLWFEPNAEQGSTFVFTLPIAVQREHLMPV